VLLVNITETITIFFTH